MELKHSDAATDIGHNDCGYILHSPTTLRLKKVLTFKLSVTLSNRNRFSKFLHCWKAYEICYKTHRTLPISP